MPTMSRTGSPSRMHGGETASAGDEQPASRTTAGCPLHICRAGLPYSVPYDNSHQPTRRRWRYRILFARVAPPASPQTRFRCLVARRFSGKDLEMLALHDIELGREPVAC